MNHFRSTASSMASSMAGAVANIGRQLPPQDVRVLTTRCSGSPLGPSRLVCVGGEYYWLNADITYQQLVKGIQPDELELEPVDPDAEECAQ